FSDKRPRPMRSTSLFVPRQGVPPNPWPMLPASACVAPPASVDLKWLSECGTPCKNRSDKRPACPSLFLSSQRPGVASVSECDLRVERDATVPMTYDS